MIQIKCIIVDRDRGKLEKCVERLVKLSLPQNVKMNVIAYVGDDMAILRNQEIDADENNYIMCVDADIINFDTSFIVKAMEIFKIDSTVGIVGLEENNIFSLSILPNTDYAKVNKNKLLYAYVPVVKGNMYITRFKEPWMIRAESVDYMEAEYCLRAADQGVRTTSILWDRRKFHLQSKNEEERPRGEVWHKLLARYQTKYIKESIRKNYYMWEYIKRLAFKEDDIQKKIKLLKAAALFATENFCGIYSDRFIEDELHKISLEYVRPMVEAEYEEEILKGTIVHVMTEAYETGGHTRVVYNWIRNDSSHVHSLLMTTQYRTPIWLNKAVNDSGGTVRYMPQECDYLTAAMLLYKAAKKYERIILHIHQNDVVPLLAFGHNMQKTPIYFFKHSGHTFFLGMGISDVIVNFPEDSVEFIRKRRGLSTGKTAVITMPRCKEKIEIDRNTIRNIKNNLSLPLDAKVVTSMAPSWRYTQGEYGDFDEFACKLTASREDLYFVLIGPDEEESRWRHLKAKSDGKIVPIGEQNKLDVQKIFGITDLYIDSFALGSPGAVLDAAEYGLPIMSLNSPEVWLQDFLYKNVDDMLEAAIRFIHNPDKKLWIKQQNSYKKQYNMQKCIRSLEQLYKINTPHRYNQFDYVMPGDCTRGDLVLAQRYNKFVSISNVDFEKMSLSQRKDFVEKLYEIYMQENMYSAAVYTRCGS